MSDTPTETGAPHQVRPVREFLVRARLPDPLHGLEELARNLAWTWDPRARELFERIDPEAWHRLGHSPLRLMAETPAERWAALAQDDSYLSALDGRLAVLRGLQRDPAELAEGATAYFCAEFGLHESLAIYSGGLGVLAGDCLKAASDLALPVVAVGLMYHEGYFRQRLDIEGWQQEEYPAYDRPAFPGTLQSDAAGEPLLLKVPMGGRELAFQVWRVDVGRVPLYLLDANVAGASDQDRKVTARLYGGDRRMRLEQEVLLGIGGTRALAELGIRPASYHMNEGHSALLTLEQTRLLAAEHGLAWDEAQRLTAACNVFTTHTPVAAGHDEFARDLMAEYLTPFCEDCGVSLDDLLSLGALNRGEDEPFSMTVLGLRMSRYRNGVSRLHGQVSREMWTKFWPQLPVQDVPIGHVTNGVHVGTWLNDDLRRLYGARLGEAWLQTAVADPVNAEWSQVRSIPEDDLWHVRNRRRQTLVHVLRRRLRDEAERRGESPEVIEQAAGALDPDALTLGFCRRFATYKRATLLFRDLDRLTRLVGAKGRPVQFVFAGKAHPRDEPGKKFLQEVMRASRDPRLRGRLVFVEGYDLELGRHLVQGVDVWLNTPRRPYEASGTSGMKAALNGALNLSVLDGWWCEGYRQDNGWAFGAMDAEDEAKQDEIDGEDLYELLESEVVPRFYERDDRGVPMAWARSMKENLAELSARFSASRMMRDYDSRYYRLARTANGSLAKEAAEPLRGLIAWWASMETGWPEVSVVSVEADLDEPLEPGTALPVSVEVASGWIPPADLRVEVHTGFPGAAGQLLDPSVTEARFERTEEGRHVYTAKVMCNRTGRQGLAVRVRPYRVGVDLLEAPTLVRWG